jgi:hypothetical protein
MTTTKTKARRIQKLPTSASKERGDLPVVFDEMNRMMARHAPPFKEGTGQIRDKRDYHLIVQQPVVLAPNAYGGKPYQVAMARRVLQKDFVGFYYMPAYMTPGIKKRMNPELAKLLKGKSCFRVKMLTPELRKGIREALELGVECFRERGWV